MTTTIERPSVLVVEGIDEERFFTTLLKYLRKDNVQVLAIGGKTNLRSKLKALVLTPSFKDVIRLGIVRDADDDPQAAFHSVCGALTAAGLARPPTAGIAHGTSPLVAVLIVPSAGVGALEDVCLGSVVADPVMPCLTEYFQCMAHVFGVPRHQAKAKVQAFLASRPEAGKRLGEAAEAGYWPWEADAFLFIRNFVQLISP